MLSTEPCSIRLISWFLLTDNQGSEPGSWEGMPKNGYAVETMNHFGEGYFFAHNEAESQDWVEFKALEFA